jgi:carbon starvation protein CstA
MMLIRAAAGATLRANQLLAATALAAGTTILVKSGRPRYAVTTALPPGCSASR